ncbi:MAG: shikimate dehydrogenase [Pseudomonadales bacterium]|nr:shikimate dehydrogenase [Pseudomonadales bacterium]
MSKAVADLVDQYVVMGNPIEHSKSPTIQMAFAKQTQQQMDYVTCLVPIDQFNSVADQFFLTGMGCNITVPFKEQAFAYANVLTERAQFAGAVNTLKKQSDGSILGDNTDGIGLVTDILKNHGGKIKDQRILVLGAGGAVRGVLGPLLAEHPELLVIANRTESKAVALAEKFQARGNIETTGFQQLQGAPFDLIINGTAASLAGELPPIPESVLSAKTWCYDMMYSQTLTPFNRWATDLGVEKCIDGLGMLIEQAAEAFYVWRGVRPDTAPVIGQFQK